MFRKRHLTQILPFHVLVPIHVADTPSHFCVYRTHHSKMKNLLSPHTLPSLHHPLSWLKQGPSPWPCPSGGIGTRLLRQPSLPRDPKVPEGMEYIVLSDIVSTRTVITSINGCSSNKRTDPEPFWFFPLLSSASIPLQDWYTPVFVLAGLHGSPLTGNMVAWFSLPTIIYKVLIICTSSSGPITL